MGCASEEITASAVGTAYRRLVYSETALALRFRLLSSELEHSKATSHSLKLTLAQLQQDHAPTPCTSLSQLRYRLYQRSGLQAMHVESQRLERVSLIAYVQILETTTLSTGLLSFVAQQSQLGESIVSALGVCEGLLAELKRGPSPKRETNKPEVSGRRKSRSFFPTELDQDRRDRFFKEIQPFFSLSSAELSSLYLSTRIGDSAGAEEFTRIIREIAPLRWLVTQDMLKDWLASGKDYSQLLYQAQQLLRSNLEGLVGAICRVFSLVQEKQEGYGQVGDRASEGLVKKGKLTGVQKEQIKARIALWDQEKNKSASKSTLANESDSEEDVSCKQQFLSLARVQAKQVRPATEQTHRPRRRMFMQTSAQAVRNTVLGIDQHLSRVQKMERSATKQSHRPGLSLASPKAFWRLPVHSRSGSSSLLASRLSSPSSGSRPLIHFESVL